MRHLQLLPLAAALSLLSLGATTISATAQDNADDGPLPFDALPADAASPFGGMAISPTRLALDAGGRGESVTLYNSGGKPVTYRIELVELGLDEAGNYRQLSEGEEADWSAARYLRYSPRQVTLQPGERQSVRVIARAPRNLPAGERRSHMRFSSIPLVEEVDEAAQEQSASEDSENTVSVSVGLDFQITIPVLLRSGQPEGGAAIQSVSRSTDNPQTMTVVIERTGLRSNYGVLRALDANGEEVGVLRGLAVLPPSKTRTVSLTLRDGAEPVSVVFEEQIGAKKTGERLAQFQLP